MTKKKLIDACIIVLMFLAFTFLLNEIFSVRLIQLPDGKPIEKISLAEKSLLPYIFIAIIFKAIFFCFNYYSLLPRFLKREKKVYYLIYLIPTFLFCFGLEILVQRAALKGLGHITLKEIHKFLSINVFLYFLFFGFSIAFFFTVEWIKNERLKAALTETQLSSEINFLKSQINPHFLFNTLNNLVSMAQEKNNEVLADSISKLSGIMRYMIYESNTKEVPLTKEIIYLKGYIGLHMLRFNPEDVILKIEINGSVENVIIAPMMLIPFLENAFKHGIAINRKSFISIRIDCKDELLCFQCKNSDWSNISRMDKTTGGIGLKNVKRRLDIIYGENYKLHTESDGTIYAADLKIKIKC